MNSEEFRHFGARLVDWTAEYHDRVGEFPVQSRVRPGEIYAAMPSAAPEDPEDFEAVLKDLDDLVLPGLTHWQSPNFFAYFPANTSFPSVLGELVSAGLGVQGMLWSTSPACTEIETRVLDWMAGLYGLPEKFLSTGKGGGVIQDSASSAVLCAMIAARERATGMAARSTGCPRGLRAYASEEAHSSVERAAMVCGIGSANLVKIGTRADLSMDPAALQRAIDADQEAGLTPFFVSATVGTTSTNAMDPLDEIGAICSREGLWMHVDAAMAGTAAICPEFRGFFKGVEYADSYCANPHKWMFTNFDCDLFFVADRKALTGALSINPAYLANKATESGSVIDYRDWQVPLGRRFRALKLWFVLRSYGAEALRGMIRAHVAWARELAGWIDGHEAFELLFDPPLNLVVFRHCSGDGFNKRLLDALNASGRIFLTSTAVRGETALRLCVGQTGTDRENVVKAWRLILETAAGLN